MYPPHNKKTIGHKRSAGGKGNTVGPNGARKHRIRVTKTDRQTGKWERGNQVCRLCPSSVSVCLSLALKQCLINITEETGPQKAESSQASSSCQRFCPPNWATKQPSTSRRDVRIIFYTEKETLQALRNVLSVFVDVSLGFIGQKLQQHWPRTGFIQGKINSLIYFISLTTLRQMQIICFFLYLNICIYCCWVKNYKVIHCCVAVFRVPRSIFCLFSTIM